MDEVAEAKAVQAHPRFQTPGSRRVSSEPAATTAGTKDRTEEGSHKTVFYGALYDLERTVTTHLFVICPNNSGSTFLRNALATSRRTWNLQREGQRMFGAVRPTRRKDDRLTGNNRLWASKKRWIDILRDPAHYDWPRTRAAWYFQAYARDPLARVFVEKSPAFLMVVGDLARHFRNAKFLFMVRNPYAVCEGIFRVRRRRPWGLSAALEGERMATVAARHVATCLEYQRRNIEAYGNQGVFFTYEAMCSEPERVAQKIRDLVPELDDLNLRQRLWVHSDYHEMLTDMNARQIARLDPDQIAAINREFQKHRAVLNYFGYDVVERFS